MKFRERLKSKKFVLCALTVIVAIFIFFTLLDIREYRRIRKKVLTFIFSSKTNKSSSVNFQSIDINQHRAVAQNVGVPLLQDEDDIEQYLKLGKLEKVYNNTGYYIAKLNFSHPVLVPKAKKVLKEIGERFDDSTNGDFFVVTSLTRSVSGQRRLVKKNVNATPNTSTHSYGCSFDISYTRFNDERGYNPRLQKILEEILMAMQKEGKIFVIKERRIACYHVTVR